MPRRDGLINEKRAVATLMKALSIPGITGEEKKIGDWVTARLAAAGVPRRAIRRDSVHRKIPLPTQTGNVIAKLPGTQRGPRRMLMCHLDTVPLVAGVVPVRRGARIVAKGPTALGGDNRTGVASILTAVETILKRRIPHPPLTLLFTVREESGLWGARFATHASLARPALAINVDSGVPNELLIGAVGADRWEVEVFGIASHAGVRPEAGVSALAIASAAIDEVRKGGWFGRVVKGARRGTSNVGVLKGGDATNVVTDYAYVKGESRSHDMKFVPRITAAYRKAFERAVRSVASAEGRRGRVRFRAERDYHAFRLKKTAPVVRLGLAAARSIGKPAPLRVVDGGLDANYTNRNGIPTITIGAGQHNPHTVKEYVIVREYLGGCRLMVEAATHPMP